MQNHYNLLNRGDEREVLPECQRLGLAYLPFFPLASGMLTGKYTRGEAPAAGTRMQRWGERASGLLSDQNFEVVDALSAWAASHDHSLLDLAFAWLIEKPVIPSVIAGATKADQVRATRPQEGGTCPQKTPRRSTRWLRSSHEGEAREPDLAERLSPRPQTSGSGHTAESGSRYDDCTVVVPGRSVPQTGWLETGTNPLFSARRYHPHDCAGSWPKTVE